MSYGFENVRHSIYGANDPGCRLRADSVGTRFLSYITTHRGCFVKEAIEYATQKPYKPGSHCSMSSAFCKNGLFNHYKDKKGVYITYKGLHYLTNALMRV